MRLNCWFYYPKNPLCFKGKAKCLEPYEAMELQIKELVEMIESQRGLIDDTVKDFESRQKAEKELEVKAYYDKKAFVLGGISPNRMLGVLSLQLIY